MKINTIKKKTAKVNGKHYNPISLLGFIIISGSMLLTACTTTGGGKGSGPSFSTIAQPYQMAADAQKAGKKVYNSCSKLPVHQSPSGLSKTINVLNFGAAVLVQEMTGHFSPSSSKKDTPKGKVNTIAAWGKIQVGSSHGFVSTRCLVTKKLLERQNPATAKGKARKQNVSSAKRGFSEEEEDTDMSAMRGAGGKAKGGKANYGKFDRVLSRFTDGNPQKTLMTFRSKGKLGEFSK
jgi:hypothetical protein